MPPLQPAQLPGAAERASQPNILLLMPDQWRWDWDGTHEAKLRVPHMASLQGLGTSFPYGATAPAPLCAPSRACFASLREYDEAGVANNLESDYPVDKQPTYFSALQDAGYHTMVAGKDDLTKKSRLGAMLGRRNFNARRTYNAEDLGFSDSRRCLGKRDVFHAFPKPGDPYGHFLSRRTIDGHNAFDVNAACLNFPGSDPKLCKSRNSHPQAMYQDDWTAGHAVELLQAAPADKPWFLWVSFPGPHDPFDVTGPMAAAVDGLEWPASVDPTRTEKTKASGGYPSHRNTRANYAAEIENLDRLFGAVLDGAKARGHTLAKDLIVCVCSDHGEMLNDHRSIGKSQPWQGSLNVPLVCAGPGIKRNSSLDLPVALLDLGATFLDFAGAKQAKGTSARSFRGLLAGDVDPENRNRTIVHSGLQSSNFDASSLQSSGRAASSRLGGAPNASTPSRARRRRSKLERWFSDAVDSDVNEFSWRTATLGRPGGHIYKLVCCKGKCPFAPSNVGPPDADGYTRLLYDTVADPYDMHDIRKEKPDVVAVLQDSLPRTHGFDCTRSSKRSSVAPAPEETAAEDPARPSLSRRSSRRLTDHMVGDDEPAVPEPQEIARAATPVASSEFSVKPLTVDLVDSMTNVHNEGFGSKTCCCCFPVADTDGRIRAFYAKHPERLPMCGLAVGRDGVPVGYVQLAIYPMNDKDGLHDTKPGETYIEQISVSAAARGKGIGKRLVQWAEAQARAAHGTSMTLSVINGNPARRLYERFGFVVVPEDPCEQCVGCCVVTCLMGRPYGLCDPHFGAVEMKLVLE